MNPYHRKKIISSSVFLYEVLVREGLASPRHHTSTRRPVAWILHRYTGALRPAVDAFEQHFMSCSTWPQKRDRGRFTPLQQESLNKLQHELLGDHTSSCVDGDLHTTDLLVDVFHELYDEIDELVLPQLLQMCMSHQEADIVPLGNQRGMHQQ